MSVSSPNASTNTDRRAKSRRERVGTVLRDKMQQTAVVEVLQLHAHPVYGKIVKKKIRYKAHNEDNHAKAGDRVRIVETRPLSKTKRWRIAEIIKS